MGTVDNTKRKEQGEHSKYAQHGTILPRQKIFSAVKTLYMKQTGATNKEISDLLEITPQSCSTLASGSDRRQPPWCIILRLIDMLDMQLIITGNGVEISERSEGENIEERE